MQPPLPVKRQHGLLALRGRDGSVTRSSPPGNSLQLRVPAAGVSGLLGPRFPAGGPGPRPGLLTQSERCGPRAPALPQPSSPKLCGRGEHLILPNKQDPDSVEAGRRGLEIMTGVGGQARAVPERASWAFQRKHSTQIWLQSTPFRRHFKRSPLLFPYLA